MKKVFFSPLPFAAVVLLFTGCSTYNSVSVTQASGVDFRKSFHTYQWMPDKGDTLNTAYNNEIIRDNIRRVVDTELDKRKLHTAAAQPDLLLQLVVQTGDRSRDYSRVTPGFYYGPFGGSYSNNRTYYLHNRLTINMYDAKTNHLVWTCTTEGDMNRAKDLSKNIQPAVAKIMKKYPVQPA